MNTDNQKRREKADQSMDAIPGFCSKKFDETDVDGEWTMLRDAQAAVYAADAYARTTGDPAIVLTEGIDEALEAASGLVTSWGDKLPVMAITVLESDQFQTLNGSYDIVSSSTLSLDTDRQVENFSETDVPIPTEDGPTQIKCSPQCDLSAILSKTREAISVPETSSTEISNDSSQSLEKLTQKIRNFSQPIIVLGRGAITDTDPRELRTLTHTLDCPVLLTASATSAPCDTLLDYKSTFESDGALIPSGNLTWVKALVTADGVLAIGTALSEADWFGMTSLQLARGPVIQVTIDTPEDIGQDHVQMRSSNFVETLNDRLSGTKKNKSRRNIQYWRDAGEKWRERVSGEAGKCRDYDYIEPKFATHEIVSHAPEDTVFIGEGGSNGMWLWANLWLDPLLFPAQHATIGGTIPMYFGARKAHPDRPIWCVVGDGAFFYHAEELKTAVEDDLDPVIFVYNDHAWSSIRLAQTYFLKANYVGTDLPDMVDYSDYAERYGCEGRSAQTPDQLLEHLEYAKDYCSDRPLVINIDMKKDHIPFHGANFVLAELDGALSSLLFPSAISFPLALMKGSLNWHSLKSLINVGR